MALFNRCLPQTFNEEEFYRVWYAAASVDDDEGDMMNGDKSDNQDVSVCVCVCVRTDIYLKSGGTIVPEGINLILIPSLCGLMKT